MFFFSAFTLAGHHSRLSYSEFKDEIRLSYSAFKGEIREILVMLHYSVLFLCFLQWFHLCSANSEILVIYIKYIEYSTPH